MDSNNMFKFDASLEHLSSIALAISLLERPDVQKKIEKKGFPKANKINMDLIDSEKLIDSREDIGMVRDEKAQLRIINYVFRLLDSLNLPDHLSENVRGLIIKIAQKISHWREYVEDVLKIKLDRTEKIYWTSYGMIDELKIVKRYWLKGDSYCRRVECQCILDGSKYHIASFYGQENFVKKHLKEMRSEISSNVPSIFSKQEWTPYGVIAVWLTCCERQKKKAILAHFKEAKLSSPDQISAEDFFWNSIRKTNEIGVKYFWSRLKTVQKKKLLLEAAEKCLEWNKSIVKSDYKIIFRNINPFGKESAIRIIKFFLDQMIEIEKTDFICKNFMALFVLFFQTWPYQELCHKILDVYWDQIPDNQEKLLNLVVESLAAKTRNSPDYFTEKNFVNKILKVVMKNLSKEKKILFLTCNNYKIVRNLFEIFDNDALNLILNDSDLKSHKIKMINVGRKYFEEAILKGDYKIVNKFIKNMNICGEKLKSFKENLNLLETFITKGDFTSAEEHLNWLYESENQRNEVKNAIDAAEICFLMIENFKFEQADKFLTWRFGTEEEKLNLKENLKNQKYIRNIIFKIWARIEVRNSALPRTGDHTEEYIQKCNEVLNWFFDSEEKILEFKKKVIEDVYFIEKYWKSCERSFGINFVNFLKFCSMTAKDIRVMKGTMKNNINWIIDTFAVEKGRFDMVQSLIEWVYTKNGDQEERRKICKNYMNSPRGALLIVKAFKTCAYKSPKNILKLFNSWIKPSINFHKLNMNLDNFDEMMIDDRLVTFIKKMLSRRQRGKVVISRHLEGHVSSSFTKVYYDTDMKFYIKKYGESQRKEYDDQNDENEREEYGSSDEEDMGREDCDSSGDENKRYYFKGRSTGSSDSDEESPESWDDDDSEDLTDEDNYRRDDCTIM